MLSEGLFTFGNVSNGGFKEFLLWQEGEAG